VTETPLFAVEISLQFNQETNYLFDSDHLGFVNLKPLTKLKHRILGTNAHELKGFDNSESNKVSCRLEPTDLKIYKIII